MCIILALMNFTQGLSALKTVIYNSTYLCENDWEEFSKHWEFKKYKRKEIITNSAETKQYLYFILEGIQRVYFISEQNKEATLVFTHSNSFGGVLDSFLLQQPSDYYYESLTASSVLRIKHEHFDASVKKYPEIQEFMEQASYFSIKGLLTRMAELQCYSSEEKFKSLLHRSPQILQLAPHKYIANYLGIDPTNFSKLLNTIKI